METAVIITTLSKLIGLGMASYKAYKTEGFTHEDLSALKSFLDTGLGAIGRISTGDKPVGAIQLALIARSFGIALGRHWASNDRLVPGESPLPGWIRRVWDSPRATRYEEIELRLKHADLQVLMPGDQDNPVAALNVLLQLTSHPLDNPYYRALWEAFTNPALDDGGKEPLLSLMKAGDAREFEKYFRQAYIEVLATPDGQQVQRWHIELASEKSAALLHGLMLDMAGWGRRHVFGNTIAPHPNDVLPFMPLEDVYVEPFGRQTHINDAAKAPINGLIRRLLAEHHLVVVKADFGHGKSLTARTLAKELASEWLSNNAAPGSTLSAPVFIRCARDIVDGSYEHHVVIRRALWKHSVDALGLDMPMDDAIFTPPSPHQEALFILDGLDEIAFTQGQRKELFTRLTERARGKHRAVVFTRPGALDQDCLPRGTPVVELLSFQDDQQIALWIQFWNALPARPRLISLAMVHAAALGEIAKVPILLLMIAMTIAESQDEANAVAPDKSVLYERFFSHIARGKLEQGGEEHEPIAKASRTLLDCLVRNESLTSTATPVDAMLWLMSRVAWKAHAYAYRPGGKPLRVDEVKVDIIGRELGLESDVRPAIELGLILAMQMDPDGGSKDILFGHQSFREFLVARYWFYELRRLVSLRATHKRKQEIEKHLQEARLLQHDDAAYSMLQGMLGRLGSDEKHQIHVWAEATINNEDLSDKRLRDDTFYLLREAALAIGSNLEALALDDHLTLRSLITHFDLHGVSIILRAPGLKSRGARLHNCNLPSASLAHALLPDSTFSGSYCGNADLSHADLSNSNLTRAYFTSADLRNSNLSKSTLVGAVLFQANLYGANLSKSNLTHVNLECADLSHADLRHARLAYSKLSKATLSKALISNADLSNADLSNADLSNADLSNANLSKANLSNANLLNADLSNADLSNADLSNSDLSITNLTGANLNFADLRGANLAGANLAGANLAGAKVMEVDRDEIDRAGADCSEVDFRKFYT